MTIDFRGDAWKTASFKATEVHWQRHLSALKAPLDVLYADPLFSTRLGHSISQFHKLCDCKGMTLTVAETDKDVLAGICSCFYGVETKTATNDRNAVLFDAVQAHYPAETTKTIYLYSDLGPCWGNGAALFLGHPSHNNFSAAYARAGGPDYPSWGAKDAMKVSAMHVFRLVPKSLAPLGSLHRLPENSTLIEECRKAMRGNALVTLGAAAPPKMGKSNLVNCLCSVVANAAVTPCQVSGVVSNEQQHTLFPSRIAMMRRFAPVEAMPSFEIAIWDMVGYGNRQENWQHFEWCVGGKVNDREKLPLPADEAACGAVSARVKHPSEACLSLFIPVSCEAIANNAPEVDSALSAIFARAKDFKVAGKSVALAIFPVITMVDRHVPPGTDMACLLEQEKSPYLQDLFVKAERKFGPPASSWKAIGWLDTNSIDYSNTADPRAVVLRSLLLSAVSGAEGHLCGLVG